MAPGSLRFPTLLLVYLAGLALLFGTVLRIPYRNLSLWLSDLTAAAIYGLMFMFPNMQLQGAFVTYDGFTVQIVGECVGLYEVIIFSACVMAYPASKRAKLIGLPLGAVAIFGFNLVRIFGLLMVGRYLPTVFEFSHVYFWQSTLVLLVAVVWLAWIRLIVRH